MFNVYPCLQRLIYTYITCCCDQVASFGTWSQGLWVHRLKLPVFNSLLLVSLGHDVGISFVCDHRCPWFCFGFQRRPWVTMQEARCVGGQKKRLVYAHLISSNSIVATWLAVCFQYYCQRRLGDPHTPAKFPRVSNVSEKFLQSCSFVPSFVPDLKNKAVGWSCNQHAPTCLWHQASRWLRCQMIQMSRLVWWRSRPLGANHLPTQLDFLMACK